MMEEEEGVVVKEEEGVVIEEEVMGEEASLRHFCKAAYNVSWSGLAKSNSSFIEFLDASHLKASPNLQYTLITTSSPNPQSRHERPRQEVGTQK